MSCIVACGHRSKIVFFLENVQLKEKVHEKHLILNLCVYATNYTQSQANHTLRNSHTGTRANIHARMHTSIYISVWMEAYVNIPIL